MIEAIEYYKPIWLFFLMAFGLGSLSHFVGSRIERKGKKMIDIEIAIEEFANKLHTLFIDPTIEIVVDNNTFNIMRSELLKSLGPYRHTEEDILSNGTVIKIATAGGPVTVKSKENLKNSSLLRMYRIATFECEDHGRWTQSFKPGPTEALAMCRQCMKIIKSRIKTIVEKEE